MKRVLVRADDLGYCEGVNYGIAKTVREGIIRSVGVMTNMPATQHGLNLLKDVEVCYGLHTNICVGKPLVAPSLIPSIVGEDGQFKLSRAYREAERDFVVLEEVILEIEAQYERFVDLVGYKPRYFEGHAVRSDNFFRGLEIVANRHGCDFLGNPPDHRPRFRNTTLHAVVDCFLPDYEPFETLKRISMADYEDGGVGMVVYHPGYLDAYLLKTSSLLNPRTLEVEVACAPETRAWLVQNEVEVITYNDIP